MKQQRDRSLRLLAVFLTGFFAVWTLWVLLLVQFPETLANDWLRAAVRLLVWVVPAWLFVRRTEGQGVLGHLGLRPQGRCEIALGLLVAAILAPALNLAHHGFSPPQFVFPTGVNVWLNVLLTAPLAEEIVFRGLVFRIVSERRGFGVGLVASSVLFALIHLPYWWLSGEKSGGEIALSLLEVAGMGVLLGGLFHWKRSLWPPLIYHCVNNFVSLAFVR
jgi:membrane protease YdiL (CAAX protease family)